MITRQDYIAGKATREQYYGQFATEAVVDIVGVHIGTDTIKNSKDESFSEIPLVNWDRLKGSIICAIGGKMARANGWEGITLADCVCVAKQAARIIKNAE